MDQVTNGSGAVREWPRPDRVRGGNGSSFREGTAAVLALLFLLTVTFAWWLTALWPTSGDAPQWVQAARAVCFGAHPNGLPDAGGWILLVGEPIGMAGALYVGWGKSLARGLRRLAGGFGGRAFLAGVGLVVVAGLGAAAYRVASATAPGFGDEGMLAAAATAPVALSGVAPELGLVDQRGDTVYNSRFLGRPLLVTFAFGQCETVCPLLVHEAMWIRQQLGEAAPALVVVTLDPWRDTVQRLPHIAEMWGMDETAFLLGGGIEEVLRVHEAWKVAATRDERTGDIAHPPLTYVVDAEGALAFVTDGSARQVTEALAKLPLR